MAARGSRVLVALRNDEQCERAVYFIQLVSREDTYSWGNAGAAETGAMIASNSFAMNSLVHKTKKSAARFVFVSYRAQEPDRPTYLRSITPRQHLRSHLTHPNVVRGFCPRSFDELGNHDIPIIDPNEPTPNRANKP